MFTDIGNPPGPGPVKANTLASITPFAVVFVAPMKPDAAFPSLPYGSNVLITLAIWMDIYAKHLHLQLYLHRELDLEL